MADFAGAAAGEAVNTLRYSRAEVVRVAEKFNANMAPNGMMQVWSGLMLRADNEAQLAGVITNNLYQSVVALGESGELAHDFAEIFAWDIDFSRAVRPGADPPRAMVREIEAYGDSGPSDTAAAATSPLKNDVTRPEPTFSQPVMVTFAALSAASHASMTISHATFSPSPNLRRLWAISMVG